MILKWFLAYLFTGVFFGVLDALWLRFAGPALYRPALGDLLAPAFRIGPAIAFYVIFVGALTYFAVFPGLMENQSGAIKGTVLAIKNGAILGLACYAAYDLTNQATLKHWSTQVTLIDLAWGTAASALAAGLAVFALTKLGIMQQIGAAAGPGMG